MRLGPGPYSSIQALLEEGLIEEVDRRDEHEGRRFYRLTSLPADDRNALIVRLGRVRIVGHNLGYDVGDDMDCLFAEYLRA